MLQHDSEFEDVTAREASNSISVETFGDWAIEQDLAEIAAWPAS
jgi:hypothetical protein